MNRDPIGYEGSEGNLYEYVGSAPARYVDPQGLLIADGDDWGKGGGSKGNCWRYACNDPIRKPGEPHSPFPGGKDPGGVLTCKQLMEGDKSAGAKEGDKDKDCPVDCQCKILGVLQPGKEGFNDYHWYRKCKGDDNWSHKPGRTPVIPGVDDPEKDAKKRGYTTICGYLCVPEGGIDIDKAK